MGDSSDLEIICLTNMKVESPPVVERERERRCQVYVYALRYFPSLLSLFSLPSSSTLYKMLWQTSQPCKTGFRLKVSALDKIGA